MAGVVYETYLTQEGDMVDAIAYTRFGSSAGTTEAILDANPGLALTERLPANRTILIPVPKTPDRKVSTRLWS